METKIKKYYLIALIIKIDLLKCLFLIKNEYYKWKLIFLHLVFGTIVEKFEFIIKIL